MFLIAYSDLRGAQKSLETTSLLQSGYFKMLPYLKIAFSLPKIRAGKQMFFVLFLSTIKSLAIYGMSEDNE